MIKFLILWTFRIHFSPNSSQYKWLNTSKGRDFQIEEFYKLHIALRCYFNALLSGNINGISNGCSRISLHSFVDAANH